MRKLSIVGFVASIVLGARAYVVWHSCGYDCGIFSVTSGMAAMVAWYLSIVIFFSSAVLLIAAIALQAAQALLKLRHFVDIYRFRLRQGVGDPCPE